MGTASTEPRLIGDPLAPLTLTTPVLAAGVGVYVAIFLEGGVCCLGARRLAHTPPSALRTFTTQVLDSELRPIRGFFLQLSAGDANVTL